MAGIQKLFSGIKNFVLHKCTSLAFAPVLWVVSWKMNGTTANWILVCSWLLLVVTAYRTHPWGKNPSLGVVWTVAIALALGYPMHRFLWSDSELPDVTMRLVSPKSPDLVIVNQSNVTARQIKYAVALWDLDSPNRSDPLHIPIETFDFLKAQQTAGPEDIFSQLNPKPKDGDRIVGSISIECPDAPRGHTFLVSLVWGKGGWYAEAKGEKMGRLIVPSNFKHIEAYFAQFNTVPDRSKVMIGEWVEDPIPNPLF